MDKRKYTTKQEREQHIKNFLASGKSQLSWCQECDIVQNQFQLDPREKAMFAFCNQRRNRIKLLVWEDNGFWIHFKRFEKGSIDWSEPDEKILVPAHTKRKTRRGAKLDALPVETIYYKLPEAERVCEICGSVLTEMKKELLENDLLHADATTLKVLHEPGKNSTSKSFMWIYRTSACAEHPLILYDYQEVERIRFPQ